MEARSERMVSITKITSARKNLLKYRATLVNTDMLENVQIYDNQILSTFST